MTDVDLRAEADFAWRSGRAADAQRLYSRVLEAFPEDATALRRLGWLAEDQGSNDVALTMFERLTRAAPSDARAWLNLGLSLRRDNRLAEAIAAARRATELEPRYAIAFYNLGLMLEDKGELAGARAALAHAAAIEPTSPAIAYQLAALGGAAAPPSCPREYLVQLFDAYADRFDQHLFQDLDYQGPALLARIVERHTHAPIRDLVDLGCGTGMTAVPFRSRAGRIIGIDLSPRMLARAEARRVYNQLIQDDIVTALRRYADAFDLALAADVLIYIGDVVPLFKAVQVSLRPGGFFALTTETLATGAYVLNATRRYAHSRQYIERTAADAGLELVAVESAALRRSDQHQPVVGDVYLLRKPI